MIKFRSLVALATLGLAQAIPLTAGAQQQNQTVKATHGAWQIICINDSDACAMQQVGKSSEGKDAMVVRITKVDAKTDKGEAIPASVEIVAPLGVILPAGLRVQIDGGKVRATGFQICLANGCLAQDVMNQPFIDDLKRGSAAKMTVVVPGQGEVGVDISLSGFTKAFGSLKAAQLRRQ